MPSTLKQARLFKKSVRKDKRKFIDDLAKAAEAAARQHNMKTLYETTNQLSRKFSLQNRRNFLRISG